MTLAANPFANLGPEGIYALLTDPSNDLPTWPNEELQRGYVSMRGPGAVRKTQAFIDMLDKDGAFSPGWKGLDYGCGWGRIASLLLARGSYSQLDLVDAWERSLRLIEAGSFKNRYWKVSEILGDGDIPEKTYTFAYAFSVFTHLSERAFWNNLATLKRAVRSPGSVYFTVRHREFASHMYPQREDEISAALDREGFWFTPIPGDMGEEGVYGDTIVTPGRLRSALGFAALRYLGTPRGQLQHVYALRV